MKPAAKLAQLLLFVSNQFVHRTLQNAIQRHAPSILRIHGSVLLLSPRPLNRIEEKLECSFSLSPVLHAESKKRNLSLPVRKCDHRGVPCQTIGSVDPAREQNVL